MLHSITFALLFKNVALVQHFHTQSQNVNEINFNTLFHSLNYFYIKFIILAVNKKQNIQAAFISTITKCFHHRL